MVYRVSTLLVLALTNAGCTDDPGQASFGDDLQDAQVPPRGFDDVLTWIAAGHYLTWNCEPEPHAPRPNSGHGRNRICSNEALSAAGSDGTFPVGAASVKEVFDSAGGIRLYAVYRKVEDRAGGDSWYWYEGIDGDVIANSEGASNCTGCHAGAPRDFVFTVVPDL
jgi:hypothetical protein